MLELLSVITTPSPKYTLTQDKTSVNENDTVAFTLDTSYVDDGTVLYWTVSGSAVAADFEDGKMSDSFTHATTSTIVRKLSADLTTESGENFTLQIRKNSVSGPIVATSQTVTVADTSQSPPMGQTTFTSVGDQLWTVPSGVDNICILTVGAGGGAGGGGTTQYYKASGGGGGGALAYANNVAVVPGQVLKIRVGAAGQGGSPGVAGAAGGDTWVRTSSDTVLCLAGGGKGGGAGGSGQVAPGGSGGSRGSFQGGNGGSGGSANTNSGPGGAGGGAGGYSGSGGAGGSGTTAGAAGSGGGGGGGRAATASNFLYAGAGGGVGLLGQGTSGALQSSAGKGGFGGSGGSNATDGASGVMSIAGSYGGGGGGTYNVGSYGTGGSGAQGAVRIIWGAGRAYPSTKTGNL